VRGLRKFLSSTALRLILALLLNIAVTVACAFLHVMYIYYAVSFAITIVSIFVFSNKSEKDSYKVTVILFMLILPIFAIAYAQCIKSEKGSKKIRKEWFDITYRNRKNVIQNSESLEALKDADEEAHKVTNYIVSSLKLPIHANADIKYFNDGEEYYKDIFAECEKATKYIFIQAYKIIPGEIWSKLFDILRLKARAGVEIKLIYDDAICRNFIPAQDYLKMNNHGIETAPFNRVKKVFNNTFINSRNFKRMFIIDGKVGYMGGFNISDEYKKVVQENVTEHTRDSGVKLFGDPVKNLIVMFLEDYQFATKKVVKPSNYFAESTTSKKKNWILPYSKNPIIREHHDKSIILNLINNAKESILICTTYIALDDELKNALIVNARSGIKVRLVFGGIREKKYIKTLARSYFYELIREGIEIYEYKSGKFQTKLILTDNKMALSSTINLDCSKTYRHFNGGVFMYGDIVKDVINDASSILSSSQLITIKDLQKRRFGEKIKSTWNKFFALFK